STITMEGTLSVKFVGLDNIYLAVHNGGGKRFDDGSLSQGEPTMLKVQKKDSYLLVNNERIPLDNIINNPGQLEIQTTGGLRLNLEYISAKPGTFQEDAGGGSIKRE
ncbi:13850_t:CDS:2, partial [Entrophospora sp. SA101]